MQRSNGEEPQHRDTDEERDNYAKLKEPQHEDEWGQLLDIVIGKDRTAFTYLKLAVGIGLALCSLVLVGYSAFDCPGKSKFCG